MTKFPKLTISTALAVILALPAFAQESEVKSASEGEWLSLTGRVAAVTAERFTLDYGDENITVELDDFDPFSENVLVQGDEVTVTGKMDTDFVTNKTLEANSVYVAALNEYFYAAAADEEDGYYSSTTNDYWDGGEGISMTGEVASIDGEQFTLDAGISAYVVDTDQMARNPLDEDGRTRIEVGDRVVVSGEFDSFDLFSGEEIEAEAVTTLSGSASS